MLVFTFACSKKTSTVIPSVPTTKKDTKDSTDKNVHFYFRFDTSIFFTDNIPFESVKIEESRGNKAIQAFHKDYLTNFNLLSLGLPNKIDTNASKAYHISDSFGKTRFSLSLNSKSYVSSGNVNDSVYITEVDSTNKRFTGTFIVHLAEVGTSDEIQTRKGSFALLYK